jgi:hypothetical protein
MQPAHGVAWVVQRSLCGALSLGTLRLPALVCFVSALWAATACGAMHSFC